MANSAVEISDETWQAEVVESPLPVLVDFWAPTCPPCRTLSPTIEKLADEYRGRVKVVKVNTDQYFDKAGDLRITGIPTVLLFQGGREIDRLVGAKPEAKYREALCQKAGVC